MTASLSLLAVAALWIVWRGIVMDDRRNWSRSDREDE